MLAFVATTPLPAQQPDMSDIAFSQAATVLLMYDWYDAKCGGKLGGQDSTVIDAWRTKHEVDLVRRRMEALERSSPPDDKLVAARANVARTLRLVPVPACTALVALVKTDNAHFATRSPRLLAALRPAQAATPPGSPGDAVSAAATVSPPSGSISERDTLLARIEAFGFNSAVTMGVGGFLTTRIYPVVLFRNGDLLKDVTALATPGGLLVHRRQHPDDWTRWRRVGADVQLLKDGTWERLPFRTTWARLPDGFRLDGLFRSLGGAGTVAIGGDQAVTAWREYRFHRDGRVERGGGASARASSGEASVVTTSPSPTLRGQYRVEGLELLITWGDGSSERRMLVADPEDPRTGIWLDGVGYARRDAR